MNSASARASSVLPTPVGPRKTNEPIGRSGSCSPVRARRSAFATAATASSWPTTRWCSRSSMWISFSVSPSSSRSTGMPGPARDDGGDVVLVDLLLDHRVLGPSRRARRARARARGSRRSGSRRRAAGCLRARRARPPSAARRSARVASLTARAPPSPSPSGRRARRAPPSPRRAHARPARAPASVSFAIAASSISSCMTRRFASSSSSGLESISMRSREAASSTRSIALSGRKRSAM